MSTFMISGACGGNDFIIIKYCALLSYEIIEEHKIACEMQSLGGTGLRLWVAIRNVCL